MAPQLSEDDIDDLLYFARAGETPDLVSTLNELQRRDASTRLAEILLAARDEYTGNGALHMAAANGHHDLLQSIITILAVPSPQNPAQLSVLNSSNAAGNTALHWAALNGHLECVKVLIDAGADPTITNAAGHDAVYEAELNDKTEVVEWVLKEGEGLEEGIGGLGDDEGQAEGAYEAEAKGKEPEDIGYGESMEEKVRVGMSRLDVDVEKKGS